MTWLGRIALGVTILALIGAIWALRQPQHFAFRVIDPGVPGTKCVATRSSPNKPLHWLCVAPDNGPDSMYVEEIPWPKR